MEIENIKTKQVHLKEVYIARLEEINSSLDILFNCLNDEKNYKQVLEIHKRIELLKEDIKYLRA
jgi:hypothetical protein